MNLNQQLYNETFACHHFLGDRIETIGKKTQNDAIGGVERVSDACYAPLATSTIQRLRGSIKHHQTSTLAQVLKKATQNPQSIEHFLEVLMMAMLIGAKATLSPPVNTL